MEQNYNWLKPKGYIHLTGQLNVNEEKRELIIKVTNPNFIAKYAFYPLLHIIIKERKYKRIDPNSNIRKHSYKKNGKPERTRKNRPLHYANHMDALIFGYYAELIQTQYEKRLAKHPFLSECIIAYRKIPIKNDPEKKNKSTIHFSFEVFQEIRKRCTENQECAVLAFDIKSFFPSLDHNLLKQEWCSLFEFDRMPPDHLNVFKAATRFSYFMLNDLRVKGRGFDEKRLAQIRNNFGVIALYESPKAFRDAIRNGDLKIHKYPFWNKETNKPIGIPQGLPVSATLANIYLYNFDLKVFDKVVTQYGGFYRRYSDDIIVICQKERMDEINEFVSTAIRESKVEISKPKTEKFIFRKKNDSEKLQLLSTKITEHGDKKGLPLIYLGFQFDGSKILIKSSNLSKFYRRMIYAVKRKAKRAKKIANLKCSNKPVIFRRQLYKLYSSASLAKTKTHIRWKKLEPNPLGGYKLVTGKRVKSMRSNYFTYVKRASEIMNEPAILNQVKKHKKIFNDAINKHLQ